MEWLKATLEQLKSEVKVTFAFIHKPLMTRETYRHKKPLENAVEVKKLFKDNGVAVVFMGHVHRYRYFEENGIHYVLTAGAGAPLHGHDADSLFHYCRVTMTPDRITILVIDQEGKESRQLNIPLTLTN
jgi:predicted phosphodiesterase